MACRAQRQVCTVLRPTTAHAPQWATRSPGGLRRRQAHGSGRQAGEVVHGRTSHSSLHRPLCCADGGQTGAARTETGSRNMTYEEEDRTAAQARTGTQPSESGVGRESTLANDRASSLYVQLNIEGQSHVFFIHFVSCGRSSAASVRHQ